MKTLILAAAVLASALVAGCAAVDQDKDFTNAECRAAIIADPAVKQSFATISDSGDGLRDKQLTRREAYNRCMRARGFVRGGGVQPVKPAD